MTIEWGNVIINAVGMLLSVGGIGWIVTAREDKKAKQIDNKQKEVELEEYKKDEILKDWKEIAEERKARIAELELTLKEKDERIIQKDDTISELKTKLDERNTYCAVAELMRCETLQCSSRKPPFGMKESKVSDSFNKE